MEKKMYYSSLGIAALLFSLLAAAPAGAQEQGEHMGPPAKNSKMESEMAAGEKAAGVTPEQRDKMKALREEFRGKQKVLMEQIKAKREALRQDLDSPAPDRAKVSALAKEINDLQGQAATNRIDQVFKVRAIITPEQYQKLREFHEKNRAKFQEKMKEQMKGKMNDHSGMHGPWHDKGDMSEHGTEDIK